MSINEHATASTSVASIAAAQLRRHCDLQSLHFQSTDELDPIDNLIGQDRALDAIRFGSAIDRPGYNIFALGPQGTGRHAAVLSYLGLQAQIQAAPDDWIYVHNFASIHKPRAIRLPPGTAVRLRDEMEELVADLRNAVPAQFQSDEYRQRRRAIDEEFQEARDATFEDLRNKAEEQDVAVLQTPVGFALAPTHDGQVIKSEVFSMLPKEHRHEMEAKIEGLQKEMTAALEQLPQLEKRRREQIQD